METFLSCGIFLFIVSSSLGQDCTKTGPCSCTNSQGTIDLSPLSHNDGTAAYADVPDTSGSWFYSYNPCNPFSEGIGACSGVSTCQTDLSTQYFSLGTQDTATFVNDPSKGLQIQYTAPGSPPRTSFVALKCDPNTENNFVADGEDPPGSANYYFTLTSKHCCPGGPGPTPGVTISISPGSVILIVFFVLMIVYILGGLVFQTFVRKASGREMVPNYGLWSAVPGLIKDGFVFTFTCGRHSGYGRV